MADLTLLIGENNTGKTFFATVLHRVLAARHSEPWPHGRLIERELPSEVLEWVENQLAAAGDETAEHDGLEWLTPEGVLQWATDYTTARLGAFGANVREGIEYAYGADASELRRRTATRRSRDCFLRIRSAEPAWEVEVRFDSDDVRVTPPDPEVWLKLLIADEKARSRSKPARERSSTDRRLSPMRRFTSRWMWYWGSRDGLFRDWPRFAVHLPANRTGFMQSYQMLAAEVVRQSASAGIRTINVNPLPGTSADFLSLLLSDTEDLTLNQREDPRFRSLIEDFENDLRVEIALEERANAIDAVVAVTPEGKFPLSRVSSMLSELAPVILVLKGSLCRSDHITIDEPEAPGGKWTPCVVGLRVRSVDSTRNSSRWERNRAKGRQYPKTTAASTYDSPPTAGASFGCASTWRQPNTGGSVMTAQWPRCVTSLPLGHKTANIGCWLSNSRRVRQVGRPSGNSRRALIFSTITSRSHQRPRARMPIW